eukprot:RCo055143
MDVSVVLALLDGGKDSGDCVRQELEVSLTKLGSKHPTDFLMHVNNYLMKNRRLEPLHLTVIFNAVWRVLRDKDCAHGTHPKELILAVAKLVCSEMTADKGCAEFQGSAAQLMAELCALNPTAAVEELLLQIPVSQAAHPAVVRSLADFASNSTEKFLPNLKAVLAKLLPVLPYARADPLKLALSTAFSRFA